MKPRKRKFIAVSKDARKEICEELGLSQPSLSLALHFKLNSPKCIRARELALTKFKGVESEKVIFV